MYELWSITHYENGTSRQEWHTQHFECDNILAGSYALPFLKEALHPEWKQKTTWFYWRDVETNLRYFANRVLYKDPDKPIESWFLRDEPIVGFSKRVYRGTAYVSASEDVNWYIERSQYIKFWYKPKGKTIWKEYPLFLGRASFPEFVKVVTIWSA